MSSKMSAEQEQRAEVVAGRGDVLLLVLVGQVVVDFHGVEPWRCRSVEATGRQSPSSGSTLKAQRRRSMSPLVVMGQAS